MPSLFCPQCRCRLTVSDMAPSTLVCPRCLGPVPNPRSVESYEAGLYPHAAAVTAAAARPPRLTPLYYEARTNARISAAMHFVIAAVLGASAFLTMRDAGPSPVGVLLTATCVVVLVVAVLQLMYPHSQKVQVAGGVVGSVAMGCFKVALTVIGVLLLLMGACAVLISGGNLFGLAG